MTSSTIRSGLSARARSRPDLAVRRGRDLVALELEVVLAGPATMSGSSSTMRILLMAVPVSTLLVGWIVPRQAGGAPAARLVIVPRARRLAARLLLAARRQRQHQRERAALARLARHLDAPAVRLHDVPHEGEAEAAALRGVHQAALGAVELLEDLLLLRARDADAVVGHRDQHRARPRGATRISIRFSSWLYLIALLTRLSSACDSASGSIWQLGQVVRRLELQREALLLDREAVGVDHLAHDRPHVARQRSGTPCAPPRSARSRGCC